MFTGMVYQVLHGAIPFALMFAVQQYTGKGSCTSSLVLLVLYVRNAAVRVPWVYRKYYVGKMKNGSVFRYKLSRDSPPRLRTCDEHAARGRNDNSFRVFCCCSPLPCFSRKIPGCHGSSGRRRSHWYRSFPCGPASPVLLSPPLKSNPSFDDSACLRRIAEYVRIYKTPN